MRLLVDAFNDGNIDDVLAGVAGDVEIAIPVYRIGERVGPPAWTGKDDLRNLLRGRFQTGSRIEIASITDDATGAVATINSSKQGQLAVTFQFDDEGLARRLVVFKQ